LNKILLTIKKSALRLVNLKTEKTNKSVNAFCRSTIYYYFCNWKLKYY